MTEEEDPFAMTTRNLAPNILAKAYATECLKLLHVVAKQVCPGCAQDKFEHRYHVICQASIPDKLFHCAELLCDTVDEKAVSDNVQYFVGELGLNVSQLSQNLSDVEHRRRLLDEPAFWDLISSYAMPQWAQAHPLTSHGIKVDLCERVAQ